MEVELKLRLLHSKAHQSLSTVLSAFHKETHFQHNVFFDGAACELSSQLVILCLRFYGEDSETAKRCVVSLKAKALLVDGVSRVEEDEEEIDPYWARQIWADPNLIVSMESRILKRVREEFGMKVEENGAPGGEYVCLGGFKNIREVYEWNGLKLEVDETLFDFGTLYEVECESAEPDKAKELIEELLKQSGIPYSYSTMSKFAIVRSGKLPQFNTRVLERRVDLCNDGFKGFDIKPKVIDQDTIHPGCCSFCSFANSLRMTTLVKHIKKELELFKVSSNLFFNIHKKHVDIRFLVDLLKAPKHVGRLMTAVMDHLRLGGYIKVEGSDENEKFFHIDSYREVMMAGDNDVDSEEFDQRFLRIEKHLKKTAGVVGSMYIRTDFYHPGYKKAEVYAGDGEYLLMPSGIPGTFLRYKHAVCMVGTAEVLHNEKKWKAFIYLESKQPERFTHDGTGFGIVLAKAMHKTYLLRV